MANKERDDALNSMFEGILAAFNATAYHGDDDFSRCFAIAQSALASLESSGFKVIRNA